MVRLSFALADTIRGRSDVAGTSKRLGRASSASSYIGSKRLVGLSHLLENAASSGFSCWRGPTF
jgi:hypothetical protein